MTVRRGRVYDQGDDPTIPHGTPGGYSNHRCNCAACRRANAEQQRRYRKAHPERDPMTGRLRTDPPRTKVTDEMVELMAHWLLAHDTRGTLTSFEDRPADRALKLREARAALEAALNPKSNEGEE